MKYVDQYSVVFPVLQPVYVMVCRSFGVSSNVV